MSKKCQSIYVQKSVPAEIWASFRDVRVLRRAEEDHGTSVLRIAAAEGIGVPVVWRILHEQSFHPHHKERVHVLTPPHHRARVGFCQSLLAECLVNTQFLATVLFTDKARFTMGGIENFHNIHIRVDVNPHTSVASRYQHRFSINVWVINS
jgi:hypothetical protein